LELTVIRNTHEGSKNDGNVARKKNWNDPDLELTVIRNTHEGSKNDGNVARKKNWNDPDLR
jgi:hypothetical protein